MKDLPQTGGRKSLLRRFVPATSYLFSGLLLSYFVFGLQTTSAQSLGEIAREQRAQTQAHTSSAPHVYTNEDLAAEQILVPADQQRFSGDTSSSDPLMSSSAVPVVLPAPVDPASLSAATGAAVLPPVAAPQWPAGTPLGDVARYYRLQKQVRAVSAKKKTPEPGRRPNVLPLPPLQPARRTKRILASTAAAPQGPAQNSRSVDSRMVDSRIVDSPIVAVSPGDSLWKIASRYLGDGNQWREIASVNPQIADPNRIHAGDQIQLPAATTAVAATHPVRVQAGDSLWKLAKAQWGSGQAWGCIAASNPQIEPSGRIFPGQVLTLPANCSSAI
jgi:LysM repeat protein